MLNLKNILEFNLFDWYKKLVCMFFLDYAAWGDLVRLSAKSYPDISS